MILQDYMFEPILAPFAVNDEKRDRLVPGYDPHRVSWKGGIPPAMSVPPDNGGTRITRHTINALAYEATKGGFLNELGYEPTFEIGVCEKIGGYAKGAILTYFEDAFADTSDSPTRIVKKVISLQPNNKMNFVRSEANPNPYVIGSEVDGIVWWKFLTEEKGGSLMAPDHSRMELITQFTADRVSEDEYTEFSFSSDYDGWLFVRIREGNFSELIKTLAGDIAAHTNKVFYNWFLSDGNELPFVKNDPLLFDGSGGDQFEFTSPTAKGCTHSFYVQLRDASFPIFIDVYRVPFLQGDIA